MLHHTDRAKFFERNVFGVLSWSFGFVRLGFLEDPVDEETCWWVVQKASTIFVEPSKGSSRLEGRGCRHHI
jgi:hypothetical protein